MTEVPERWRRWERIRQGGRSRFIWTVGVCGWGLSVGLLWSVAFWYLMVPRPPFVIVFPLALVGFAIGGYFFGAAMWWVNEQAYWAARRQGDFFEATPSLSPQPRRPKLFGDVPNPAITGEVKRPDNLAVVGCPDRSPFLGAALGTAGIRVRVTPWDDLQYWADPESGWEFVDDRTPFVFRVEGWLEDGHIAYGVYGPVVEGPPRYCGLICSIMVREDGSDWRVQSRSSANFRVGPSRVMRSHEHDFRHPEGTVLEGYPRMSRFGEVEVVAESPADG